MLSARGGAFCAREVEPPPIGTQTINHGPSFSQFNSSLDSTALQTNQESEDQLLLWSSLGRGVTENKIFFMLKSNKNVIECHLSHFSRKIDHLCLRH